VEGAFMGVDPHALYPSLRDDLTEQLGKIAVDRICGGETSWPGMTYRDAAGVSIWNSIFKKLETGMTDDTNRRALEKFLQINQSCKDWSLQLADYGDDYLVNELKCILDDFWHRCGYPLVDHDYECLEKGKIGPGSSIGSSGGDFYTKFFSSRLSCTNRSLYFWYKRYIRNFPEWHNAELIRCANFGEAHVVEENRLSFVPKNDDISRTICTEPVLNMFFQLGFSEHLVSRLKNFFGIRLEDQQFRNRDLARRGSAWDDYVTIDLSSASDSLSIKMLEHILPASFLRWLKRFRCPYSILPNGERLQLHMISTMGNGYTFPLQTIIFCGVVMSALKCSGLAARYDKDGLAENFGVNGDDIILPTVAHRKAIRLLTLLGFKVNPDKTFVEGPFRESCGGDYFQGRNLRGPYLKRLGTTQDLYTAINALNLFSTRTGIRLSRTVQLLLKKVEFLPVPRDSDDFAGIQVPLSILRKPYRLDKGTQSICYYAWTHHPSGRIRMIGENLLVPKKFKRRIYNPSGLLISILQGSIDSRGIGVREDVIVYRRKRHVTPNWDRVRSVHPLAGWVDWQRWNTAVYLNLFG
jgi:hypothetical protein